MKIKNLLFSSLFVSALLNSNLYSQTVELPQNIIVGGVTENSARFWVRTSIPTFVNIELSTNSDFSSSFQGEGITTTIESGNAGIIDVTNLSPNTKYYYRAVASNLSDNIVRYFTTFPDAGTPSSFQFAFGSCQQSGKFLPSSSQDTSVFNEIMKYDVKFFLQLGDWGYPDTTDETPLNNNYFSSNFSLVQQSYLTKYDNNYPMAKLLREVPVDYVYDDHDYMNNNASALTSSYYVPVKPFSVQEIQNPAGARENSIRGYKENMPGYPLENDSRGIYHKFTYGNAEFFALDLRSQRSSDLNSFHINSSTNKWVFDPPKGQSILGRNNAPGDGESQLTWLLNGLNNSTADWKFIISSVAFNIGQRQGLDMGIQLQDFPVPIEGAPAGATAIAASFELADSWSGFPEDADTLLKFISDNNIKNVIVLSGDSHNAAMDDGTNSGLPEIMAGNLDITNSKTVKLFEDFGIKIWNKGGQGITTNEFNDAFGKVDVFGRDSVVLSLIDENGNKFAEQTIISPEVTSVKEQKIDNEFSLSQNYPNPFNPSTTIKYSIPSKVKSQTANVKLVIYDILGREAAKLVNEKQNPGNYEVSWNASNIPSGVYFYKLQAGNFIETKKMILLK